MAFFAPQSSTRLISISTLAILGSSLAVGPLSHLSTKSNALAMNTVLTAQEITPQPSPLQGSIDISFRQPNTDETGAPQDRPRGGGSRCGAETIPCIEQLTALVPFPENIDLNEHDRPIHFTWGQTLEAQPTLWFYLPYGADMVYMAEFELWSEDNADLPVQRPHRIFHTTELPLSATPSITGYTLPETVTLEVGKTYRWKLSVQFDPLPSNIDEWVSGRIQKVSLPAYQQQQLETASRSEQAQLLATSGIWYDLLSTMVTAYPQDSTGWQTAWQDLLTNVGLPDIAAISLADAWAISLDES